MEIGSITKSTILKCQRRKNLLRPIPTYCTTLFIAIQILVVVTKLGRVKLNDMAQYHGAVHRSRRAAWQFTLTYSGSPLPCGARSQQNPLPNPYRYDEDKTETLT